MNKKTLTFLLALAFVVSIAGVALAEFDYSVFQDNVQYDFDVEIDVMDDTGTIRFPDDFSPFDTGSSGGPIIIEMDLLGSPNAPVIIRLQIVVLDWPGIREFIFLPDQTRYTIEVLSNQDTSGTTMYESATTVIMPDLMPMFDEIIEEQITSVRYRLNGGDDIDGEMAVNIEQLKLLMDLYKEAGGLNQDFSMMESLFPVVVK